jgi:hypothetical protein
LLTGAPPPPRPQKADDDWAPFVSRVAFELADKLYRRDQASNTSVDELFDLWTADNLPHGHTAPFIDHNDMLDSIDSIPIGDVPWESFDISYEGEGEIPQDAPNWMWEKSTVWYRNPHEVVKNLIANPDFDGEFDYAPYRQFRNEKREWTDLMSANWAWRQAASIPIHPSIFLAHDDRRTSLPTKVRTIMAQCLFPSSLVVIKRQSLWQQVIMNTIPCTCLSGTFITMFEEPIAMWSY